MAKLTSRKKHFFVHIKILHKILKSYAISFDVDDVRSGHVAAHPVTYRRVHRLIFSSTSSLCVGRPLSLEAVFWL